MLILVRHGRTEANATGLLLGRLDPELDDVGRTQAAALGRAFSTIPIARIVSSPLQRTRATAAAIGERVDAPITIDERFIELDYGEFDGVPLADVPAEIWQTWRSDPTFAPSGGESLTGLGTRVRGALDSLAAEAEVDNVVVVSHVSPIKAGVAWALGVGDETTWRMFLAPASITRIAVTGRGPSLQGFNDTAHLLAPG